MRLEALDRRLERNAGRPVAVALSGGSDSTALLMLAATWARHAERRLLAFTVDHGLHPDSALWTGDAGRIAARFGVAWRALRWTGVKAATGLPAAARRARHALLAQAVREAGSCVLLMGHTADDVAESELIRGDTPGHGRLTEWAPSPVWPEGRGVFLLRPLLSLRRTALRARLQAEGVDWLEDPANADLRFARSRARAKLAALCEGDGARISVASPPVRSEGWADGTGCVHLPRAASADLLAKAVLCASGGERPPRGGAVTRLAARLRGAEAMRATLGGARVLALGETVRLVRDAGERRRGGVADISTSPLALSAEGMGEGGGGAVFDNRFEVSAPAGHRVAALDGLAARLAAADTVRLRHIAAAARPALPALLAPDGGVRLPAPFGGGPGYARALAPQRFDAACGRLPDEAAVARCAHSAPAAMRLMAKPPAPSYLVRETKAYTCAAAREDRSGRT